MRLAPEGFGGLPPAVKGLLAACFAGFLAGLFLGRPLNFWFGLVPALVTDRFFLWQPLTYMFLHGGFWHFFLNMFMLWTFGRYIEETMGTRRFLAYYLFCGAAAALFTVLFMSGSATPVIGASGAIYGLLAAFAFFYPEQQIYLYFAFPMKARTMVLLFAALEFAMSAGSRNSGVANITHLGGLVLGWLALKLFYGGGLRLPSFSFGGRRPGPDRALRDALEADRLLEKVSREGRAALTEKELRFLRDYAGRLGEKD